MIPRQHGERGLRPGGATMATIKYAVRNGGIYGSYVEFDTLVEALEFKAMKGPGALVYEPLGLTAAKKVCDEPAAPAGDAAGEVKELKLRLAAAAVREERWRRDHDVMKECYAEAEADNARLTGTVAALAGALKGYTEPMRRYVSHSTWTAGDEALLVSAHAKAAAALAAVDAPAEVHVNTRDCEPMTPQTKAALLTMFQTIAEKYRDKPPIAMEAPPQWPQHDAPAAGGSDALQAALDKSARCLRCNDTGKVPCVCQAEHAPAASGEPVTVMVSADGPVDEAALADIVQAARRHMAAGGAGEGAT